jgi:hypothetical protein
MFGLLLPISLLEQLNLQHRLLNQFGSEILCNILLLIFMCALNCPFFPLVNCNFVSLTIVVDS